ncbi:MAG: hypothetical protein AAFY57_07965 [Cyanobacteria bacterium J06642_2]
MMLKYSMLSLTRGLGWLAVAAIALNMSQPSSAHQVKIDETVGGTLHVEPNDTPQAGVETVAWFALVKKGGNPIPLSACECRLAIYALPRESDAPPLLAPALQPIDVGRDRGIPSAGVTFPEIGRYELVLQGAAKNDATFDPFELSFEVTVAAKD